MHVWLRPSPRALVLVNDDTSLTEAGQAALVVSTTELTQKIDKNSSSSVASLACNELDAAEISESAASSPRAVVELVRSQEIDRSKCRRLTEAEATGCLGLMNVGSDLFLCAVTHANEVGPIRTNEKVMSISAVAFYCVNRPSWDGLDTPDQHLHPGIGVSASAAASSSSLECYDAILPQGRNATGSNGGVAEHPCASLKRLLSMGSFYYAANGTFDLSTSLSRRVGRIQKYDISQYDDRFVWNTFMMGPLINFRSRLDASERETLDSEGFLLLAIQGFVGVFDISRPTLTLTEASAELKNPHSSISLVSRLSWRRAGTRFNTRGVDDDGNVANFVESETFINHEGVSMSYVQLRGSVPVFWEQPGLQAFSPRIQITRSRQASQPAFDRHFADLLSRYSRVHALNLLGTRDAETVLTNAYAEHLRSSLAVDEAVPPEEEEEGLEGQERLGITNFDFHSVSRNAGGLDSVRAELILQGPVRLKQEEFSCTIIDSAETVRRKQVGVFRTNCLDCLDRTNVVQAMLSEIMLAAFFEKAAQHRESFQPLSGGAHPVWNHHRTLWAENGDALSRIYAGTGALNSTYTRTGNAKKTFGSLLSNAAKSAGRMYINNFQDKSKQNVIDALLGNMVNQRSVEVYDPVHDAANAELNARLDEYSTRYEIVVFAGTWNLNARAPSESLLPWLCPEAAPEPDVYALGFQEIVQLTPQQILSTDPTKLRMWEGVISDTLARRPDKKCDYVILRSEQLVGTALTILVKSGLLPYIRQVEATSRKTGLKGMSGNKGGVAIRFTVHDTSFCFVTAHFAAGHSMVNERNNDYHTISRGLTFNRGRNIACHDHVVWLGDFNYRIDLPNECARALAKSGNLGALYAHDQLHRSRRIMFQGFEEGPLTFAPTYKYDVGSDAYDSSEKQRVPAWTDRILYLHNAEDGHKLRQISYSRAELKTSDHRPVFAHFRAEVRILDKDMRNAMRREILSRFQTGQGRSIAGAPSIFKAVQDSSVGLDNEDDDDDEDDNDDDDDDDDPNLPDPSSPNATQGSNWFDTCGADEASTSGSETDIDAWSDEDTTTDAEDDGSNPFLLSKGRILAAAAAAAGATAMPDLAVQPDASSESHQRINRAGTISPIAERRPPPPAPPRPWKAVIRNSANANSSKDGEGTPALSLRGFPDERFFGLPTPASSSCSLPLGAEGKSGSAEQHRPHRPQLGNRSSSYAGASVLPANLVTLGNLSSRRLDDAGDMGHASGTSSLLDDGT